MQVLGKYRLIRCLDRGPLWTESCVAVNMSPHEVEILYSVVNVYTASH